MEELGDLSKAGTQDLSFPFLWPQSKIPPEKGLFEPWSLMQRLVLTSHIFILQDPSHLGVGVGGVDSKNEHQEDILYF